MAARRSATMIVAVTAACCPLVLAGAGQAAAGTRVPAGAVAAAPGGTWHAAVQVPGTAVAGNVDVESVSCGSAGNCTAGGSFLASEVKGRWHTAINLPGPANKNGTATVNSVSCASAGDCAAGGYYYTGLTYQAFVVSEVNGRWRTATEVPGTAALNRGGTATVNSVSCSSAGNCSAGGQYASATDGGGRSNLQAFVAGEINGRWHTAIEVPGTAALNKDEENPGNANAGVASVSCRQAASCTALGWYTGRSGYAQAFVASES